VNIANNVVQDPGVASVFPGLFLGTPLVGSQGPIESYGFVEITLTDPAGIEQLSLDPAVGATIYIPVNPNPVGVNSIPLWRLDDATGIWEQTGTATRVGSTNVFEAEVTSFSFYNLDRPMENPVILTVTAYEDRSLTAPNMGSTPAPGVTVTVDILDSAYYGNVIWQGRGITDANGELELSAPPGFLSVVGKKGSATYNGFLFQQTIGAASINIFNFAPPLDPPPPPPPTPQGIDLVVAAGNTYFPATTRFIIVEDAGPLVQAGAGPWYLDFALELYGAYVVDIQGNTLEFNTDIELTAQQAEGATISFYEG
jgi:hypothetical protein